MTPHEMRDRYFLALAQVRAFKEHDQTREAEKKAESLVSDIEGYVGRHRGSAPRELSALRSLARKELTRLRAELSRRDGEAERSRAA